MTSVAIPYNVISIGERAFENCVSLTFVSIPSSVTSISERAFYECRELNHVNCYAEKIPDTGYYTFDGTDIHNGTLHVPSASVENYRSMYPWSHFRVIIALIDEETGIHSIENEQGTKGIESVTINDLNGRRFGNRSGQFNIGDGLLSKGVYIVNGKKVLIK